MPETETYTQVLRMLREDIADVRGTQKTQGDTQRAQGELLASTNQQVAGLSARLFDQDGAVPRLAASIAGLETRFTAEVEKENRACSADRDDLHKRVDAIEKKAAWFSGAGAAAGLVVGASLRFLASKLHLN